MHEVVPNANKSDMLETWLQQVFACDHNHGDSEQFALQLWFLYQVTSLAGCFGAKNRQKSTTLADLVSKTANRINRS
jgi:hypothetical protein